MTAAAGLVSGSSALHYFSQNRRLQAIVQKESAAVANTATRALREQVELKRQNAALQTQVVGLQQDQVSLSKQATGAYRDLFDAKIKLQQLEKAGAPRSVSPHQATKMLRIVAPYAVLQPGVKRLILFTANADNVESQDYAQQLRQVFDAAGWDACVTSPVWSSQKDPKGRQKAWS